MKNKTDNTNNEIILIILGLTLGLFLIITSLPAFLISLIFIMVLMKVKINKLLFGVIGLILGVLLNIRVKFGESYLLPAIDFIKKIFTDSQNITENYKVYIININFLWQIIFSIIIASLVAHYFSSFSNTEEKEKQKEEEKKMQREKLINKEIEKIQGTDHSEEMTTLGIEYDKLEKVEIKDKARHIAIAGTTGAGKTVAISNFIESAMQKGNPIFAVDGKGDLEKGSLLHYMQELSDKYNKKLYVINITKPELSDLYNPFKDAGITEAKDMLIGMNNWSEEHYKVNTERYLQQLIRILKLANIELDLNTIITYSPNILKDLIEKLKDSGTLSIEDYTKVSEIIQSTKQIVESAMARFATTAESEAGEIFNSKGIDIFTAMKEKANILIILDSLGKPELSRQVGRLAVLDAKKAVSKLFGDKTRKFFILDEFNVYASDVAVDLLNKSRSANVTCIPAFQSLSDLDKAGGVALRNQVIENCNNYIIMRQNSPDSSLEWEKVMGQEEIMSYTYSIKEDNSIFGKKNKNTGTGSMYKTYESRHKASEIQELQEGQCFFVSKDQKISKKIKIKYIPLNSELILNKRRVEYQEISEIDIKTDKKIESNNEKINLKEIEKMLN